MEQEQTFNQLSDEQPKRPDFLSVICILSFIGSGLWALFSFIGIFAANWFMNFLGNFFMNNMEDFSDLSELDADAMEKIQEASQAMELFNSLGTGVIIAMLIFSLILAIVSLLGVAKMWKLKKSGFIMYVIANGILLLFSLIGIDVWGILINGGFIAMYAVNLKHLR